MCKHVCVRVGQMTDDPYNAQVIANKGAVTHSGECVCRFVSYIVHVMCKLE